MKLKTPANNGTEELVTEAWESILRHYFPGTSPEGGPCYAIHRRPPTDTSTIVVVRYQNVQQLPAQEYPAPSVEREILWVRCFEAGHDKEWRWNKELIRLSIKLRLSHQSRRVYVVLAFGLRWIPFLWDPASPLLPLRGPVAFLKPKRNGFFFQIHDMYYPWIADQVQTPVMAVWRKDGGVGIDTLFARSLDRWRQKVDEEQMHRGDRDFLEMVFHDVKTTGYEETNLN